MTAEHPLANLMETAMERLKGMVDVNTVVGDAVETEDGTLIIPVSRVSFGFVAGGGQYGQAAGRETGRTGRSEGEEMPFGGGSGAGVSVSPVGFLVIGPEAVRFLPVDQRVNLERILDVAPEVLERLRRAWSKDGRGDGQAVPAGRRGARRRAREGTRKAESSALAHDGGFEDLDDQDDDF